MKNNVAIRPAIGTGALLLIPLVMTFLDRNKQAGDGWSWGPGDFLIMGLLLFGAGITYEVVSRRLSSTRNRAAVALFVTGVVLVIWVELAVGGVSQFISWATP